MPPRALGRTPLDAWFARSVGVPLEALTRQDVERHQLGMLRQTVGWARARSPLYRERLERYAGGGDGGDGGGGGDPTSLADLRDLPLTTDDDLREHGPRLVCVSQDEIRRVVSLQSSGTTGARKRLFFTAAEQESIVDFFAAGMSAMTSPGDRVVIFLPGHAPGTVGALLATALERLDVVPVPHGFVRDVRAAVRALEDDRPTSFVALPTHALALARFVEERIARQGRARGGSVAVKCALLTADYVPPPLARAVERALRCTVFEHYGMTEMGLGGGVDCEAHDGYHLREADLLFEILDPHTGAPMPDGAAGEVVVTTLTRRAMPLLRYRTRDLARFLPDPCPCGGVMRRMARVRGRIGAGAFGGVTLPDLDDRIFACPGVVDFRAEAALSGLRITAFTLAPPDDSARRTIESICADLPPPVTLDIESLEGHLTTGPDKRLLQRRPEVSDGS
jgi:phenylacetate-CoA ligase